MSINAAGIFLQPRACKSIQQYVRSNKVPVPVYPVPGRKESINGGWNLLAGRRLGINTKVF
jgi:hypothetical protein